MSNGHHRLEHQQLFSDNDRQTTEREPLLQVNASKRKKKCHGDRKKQRFRRQLYQQGYDSEMVRIFEKEKFHTRLQETREHYTQNSAVSMQLNQVYILFFLFLFMY